MLQYLRLIAIYGFILFCLVFIAVASHAQDTTSNGEQLRQGRGLTQGFVMNGQAMLNVDGECRCFNGAKSWPCRKAKGDPPGSVLTVNRCFGGGIQLNCPADRGAICEYALMPPICSDPPLTNVCYPGDEPK